MRRILLIAGLIIAGMQIAAAQTPLSAAEAENLRAKIIRTAQNTATVTSDFVQKKHLDFLENDVESSGRMYFKSPDLLKWEYTAPFVYGVVFKENKLLVNDDGNKSKVDLAGNKLFRSLNDLIAKSVTGDMFDEEEFTMRYFKVGGDYRVDFYPKRKELNTYIEIFQLTFDGAGAQVTEVKMIEPSADYTHIIFRNRLLNEKIADSVFNY